MGGAGTPTADLVRVPLWVLVGARSGDKGGDANVGVWADEDEVADWLQREFTVDMFTALLPEVQPFAVSRYPLPNLRAVNFVVHGILGWGVASNLRLDTQAKGLGELLRSRLVDVPASLVSSGAAGGEARLAPDPGRPQDRPPAGPGIWQDGAVELARLVALVAGIAIVVLTVWSVFTALVVPRATSSRLLGTLARTMSGVGAPAHPAPPELTRRGTASSRSSAPPPWCRCSSCGCA